MAKFCINCGSEIPDGVMFCTNCGAKIEENTPGEVQTPETVPEVQAAAPPEVQETPVQPAPQPQPQTPPQPVYQQPAYAAYDIPPTGKYGVVSTIYYFFMMIFYTVPVIGPIVCIITAFKGKNQNKKNFARAMLIWLIISLIIGLVFFFAFRAIGNFTMNYINEASGGEIGNLKDLMDMANEFKNLDLEGLEGLEGIDFENLEGLEGLDIPEE